jgi:hypothetical protein
MWTALLLLKTFYLVGGKSVYRRLVEFWKIFEMLGGSKREGRSRVHFSQVIPAAKEGRHLERSKLFRSDLAG